ncbi:aminotransferase class III-fold pyridoxal phosphate-dependent enzyme [Polynucleobacter necessarius]|uniref:aminotransferase class III-fold pyridoxal phosphate-dependent enzyme n=1 Tax=Polynucleobacter necessarius TaxID=576610 RepID=UPI000E090255|nr:aminotransferase class III-fold pyridoxal phosphate-dependent enzyme [Polynucleobacter necessarius]
MNKSKKGLELWGRAKKVIPGGNMLLSKRSEMFLPERWPSYFDKSRGCTVWDLDGNSYVDMSIMGIGTNSLGYGHKDVDKAVMEVVQKGNMSTFNCLEEVLLAEKLLELHPWADMVRLARTGGEANAIAIRIARAASGRDGVAICGYHGWHDWYLSANIRNNNQLSDHLLPGLSPNGVPNNLGGTVFPFRYNNTDEFMKVITENDIGVVKMEVCRNERPAPGFLEFIRDETKKRGIVLIFDECTSGFRETYGGLHLKYGVNPDMAVFGKALGNGYAITAVIGSKNIMEAAQSTFISSTFWSERIGPAAGIATLDVMKKLKSWEINSETGERIKELWKLISIENKVPIKVSGLSSIPSFSFDSPNHLALKTFLTQEMLKKGYLATPLIFVCTKHEELIVKRYGQVLNDVFREISHLHEFEQIVSRLDGPVCHDGFKRLN